MMRGEVKSALGRCRVRAAQRAQRLEKATKFVSPVRDGAVGEVLSYEGSRERNGGGVRVAVEAQGAAGLGSGQ